MAPRAMFRTCEGDEMKAASPPGALPRPRRGPLTRVRVLSVIPLAVAALVSAGCAGSSPAAPGPGSGSAPGAAARDPSGPARGPTIPLLREGTTYPFSNLTEQYADGLPEANWAEHLVRVGPDG